MEKRLTRKQFMFYLTYDLISQGVAREQVMECVEIGMDFSKKRKVTVAETVVFVLRWFKLATDSDVVSPEENPESDVRMLSGSDNG